MNKVFNINLGGLAFTIDEDAYSHLQNYIESLRNHFKDSEGYDEIIFDIEARMGEIFQDKLHSRQIVTLEDVKEGISIMGTPEEFGAESIFDEPQKNKHAKDGESATAGAVFAAESKRLYRDPDEKILGGVCAGVSQYFGIKDPIWLRLAFAVGFFVFGFGLPIYIVLWVIVPEAKNSAQKLSMRGKSINVSNIAETIEGEISHIRDRFSSIGDEFSSKKKVLEPMSPSENLFRK